MANLRANRITSTEVFETTGSVQFDGSGDYLSAGSIGDWDFLHNGSTDWTISYWLYPSIENSRQTILSTGGASGTIGFATRIMESGNLGSSNGYYISAQISRGVGGSYIYWDSDPVRLTNNRWYNISLVFKASNKSLSIYLDGELTNGINDTGSGSIGYSSSNSGYSLNIGREPYTDILYYTGHISNLRILKGTALYTENFTPPTRELEVIPNTVLLACQSTTKADEEKTGKTITVNGNAVANELTPGLLTNVVKSGGSSAITGSVEFDGDVDYLTLNGENDFAFGTGDFTVEMWVYHSVQDVQVVYYDSRPSLGNGAYPALYKTNTNYLAYYANSSTRITGSTAIVQNSWNHIVLCRNGTSTRLFLNGIQQGATWTDTTNYINGASRPTIGADGNNPAISPTTVMRGFISNLRVIKGTALYTSNFIPPTRNLTKLPGTVLLCCQDPDNPLTEATGKTITPYGSLGDGSTGPELVTSNDVWTMICGGSGCSNWTVSNNGRSLAGTTVTSGYMRATYTLDEGDYLVSLRWTGGNFAVQDSTGYIVATDGTYTDFGSSADGAYSFYMSDTTSVVITATSWNTAYTVDDISIKRIYKNNGASNFTPSVGSDGSVEFAGPTTINTENYFYLPTGPTEQRFPIGSGGVGAGTRGLVFGGYYGSAPNRSDVIDYVTIASTGDAVDFGDRLNSTDTCAACASATRALNAGGYNGSATINTIEYVTIASTGNAQDFGDLTITRRNRDGCSSSTRGLFGGGFPTDDVIEYVTIATSGNSIAFGNLTESRYNLGALASPVRGVFGGGTPSTDTMDFVTIATTADAIDFGNLTAANGTVKGTSSETRGIFGFSNNVINYITIASTGDAIDFGDLNYNPNANACTSSLIRGIFMGGGTPTIVNTISYITIASTGDAVDFGDLTQARQSLSATSSGHGGLG